MADVKDRLAGLSPEKRALLAKRLQQAGGQVAGQASGQAGAAAAEGSRRPEPLAIVGVGCRFPGQADSPEAFWQLIAGGVDAISEVPADRWPLDALYDPDPGAQGKVASRWGGFIDQVDRFDATLFGITPREAEQMDPQQRILLETAWAALEHAGLTADRLRGSNVGVFVGAHSHSADYCWLQYDDPAGLDGFSGTGTAHNFLGGRLSYLLDVHGPAIVVDTACSSSLVAVHLACQSLRAGECSLALVAGINLMLSPMFTIAASRMRMLSPDGRCKAFDASANGFVRAEGCGVVVIKPLAQAVAAGDRVLAVIRGSAINQDGHRNGITAPNGRAQERAIRDALAQADIDPKRVTYVEAHGTGTPLGDPIEVEALGAVIGQPRPDGSRVVLGSVKANIGHLEGAAGVAGLIKATLCLHHRQLPPLVHFRALNPHLRIEGTSLDIGTPLQPWASQGPRVAGVSSFGWSGTNAHVVLEEAPPRADSDQGAADGRLRLLPLSARTPEALDATVRTWAAWAAGPARDGTSFAAACASAASRRSHHEWRAAAIARELGEAGERLAAFAAGESTSHLQRGHVGERPGIVFVFPGQGSQWLGMGRQLLATEPVFRETIEACERAFAAFVDWSLTQEIAASETTSRLREIDVVQPTLFAIEVALAALWRSWGVHPYAVVGHSMGEVAAACVAGALSIDDAARIICGRSRILRRIAGQGAMGVVELSVADAQAAIAGYAGRLSVAVSNSPDSTVVAGDTDALHELLATLEQRGVFCRAVQVDVASHSPHVDPLRAELLDWLAPLAPRAGTVPMRSTVTASYVEGTTLNADYWARNLREPVLLAKTVQRLLDDGMGTFIEMSPHPGLVPPIESTVRAAQREGLVLPSLRRGEDEREALLASAARLYVEGHDLDWTALNGPGAFVDVPGYPFQRERFWLPPAPPRAGAGLAVATAGHAHPMLGAAVDVAHEPGARIWPIALDTRQWPFVTEHRLDGVAVLPASVSLELLLGAAAAAIGEGPISLRAFELCRPLFIRDRETPLLQVSVVPGAEGAWQVRLHHMVTGAAATVGAPTAPVLLAQAQAQALALAEAPPPPGSADTTDADATVSGEPVSAESFYLDLEQRGVQIGERLRSVTHMERNDERVIATLARPGGGMSSYRLDPAISDGLLQLTAAITGDRTAVYMPTTIGEVRWHRRAEGNLTAMARCTGRAAGEVRERLCLRDAGGMPVVELDDVCLRAIGAGGQRRPARVADWLYTVQWRALPLPGPSTVKLPSRRGRWILLADEAGLAAEVARWLERKGQSVTLARAGDRFAQEAPDRFVVRPSVGADCTALFDAASRQGAEECRGIVCLWALDVGAPADGAALDRAFDRSVAAALCTVQAAARRAWEPVRPRVWLVTRGAQVEAHAPWAATVWGLGRVIAEEHHDLYGGLVDLDPAADAAAAAEQIGLTVWSDDGEPETAWRASQRLVPRLARVEERPAPAMRWRTDATYVVTGAFGGIGQVVARGIVQAGARHLLLVGRTPLPPRATWRDIDVASPAGRRVAIVRELEAAGATVHLAIVDIADDAAVRARLAEHEREGWPAVRGVLHCAAVTEDRLVDRLDEAALAAVLRPKARGAWVLQRELGHAPLDFVLFFSSLGAVFGQPGQAAYAAANAFLDATALSLRDQGVPVCSVNWGGWRGLGFADTAGGQRTIAGLEEAGIHTFDAREGLEALAMILGAGHRGQVAVAPIDWQAFARHHTEGAAARLATDLVRDDAPASGPEHAPSRSLRDELAALEDPARRERLEAHLAEQLAQILRVPLSRLDATTPLGSLGLQSLSALELRNRLERSLGMKLPATLVWNHPTVRALATYLLERSAPATARAAAQANAPSEPASGGTAGAAPLDTPPVASLGDVDRMSEDEALNALLGGRG